MLGSEGIQRGSFWVSSTSATLPLASTQPARPSRMTGASCGTALGMIEPPTATEASRRFPLSPRTAMLPPEAFSDLHHQLQRPAEHLRQIQMPHQFPAEVVNDLQMSAIACAFDVHAASSMDSEYSTSEGSVSGTDSIKRSSFFPTSRHCIRLRPSF